MMIFKKKTAIGKTNDLIPSPRDERDYLLSSYAPVIVRYPEECPAPFDLDILNQQQEPSCVGFSLSGIKQYNELRERTYRIFDGNWIYREAKKIDGIPNFAGTYLRSGLQVLKDVGAKTGTEDPSIYRIASYAKVDDLTFEGLKKAIFLYGVVLVGYRGSNQGWASETVRPANPGETQWAHAVYLVGYDKNYLYGHNSWGTNAHNQGRFRVPKSYLPFEAWTILLDKTNEFRAETPTCWAANTYIKDGKTVANLNCRVGAGTKHQVLKVIPRGTKVNFTGTPSRLNGTHWWTEIDIDF